MAEFKELKRRLEREMTPQALSQFQAHQKLMGMVDTDDDETSGYSFKMNEEDLFD